jgi:hypothetical protein
MLSEKIRVKITLINSRVEFKKKHFIEENQIKSKEKRLNLKQK